MNLILLKMFEGFQMVLIAQAVQVVEVVKVAFIKHCIKEPVHPE